jgi:hypothetical protein
MIKRIIADIEAFLASPMQDAGDYFELKERRTLGALLEMLKTWW